MSKHFNISIAIMLNGNGDRDSFRAERMQLHGKNTKILYDAFSSLNHITSISMRIIIIIFGGTWFFPFIFENLFNRNKSEEETEKEKCAGKMSSSKLIKETGLTGFVHYVSFFLFFLCFSIVYISLSLYICF